MENTLKCVADALYSALYKDVPDIVYETIDWRHKRATGENKWIESTRKPEERDLTIVAMFPQVWCNTAIGFGGIACNAITTAYTIVIGCEHTGKYYVYFNGKFAYEADEHNDVFIKDVQAMKVASVADSGKYKQESDEETQTI
jgi:hypothetical protein